MHCSDASADAQLAVAPEGALDGYVVMPIVDGAEPEERMHEAAVSIRGPEVTPFRAFARKLGIRLAFGLAERTEDVAQEAVPQPGRIDALALSSGTVVRTEDGALLTPIPGPHTT